MVPAERVRILNDAGENPRGEYVLYWMIAQRRTEWNFSLQRGAELAQRWERPLLVFEPLRSGYRWASDRLHAFVIEGMADNAQALAARHVLYYPYLEPEPGAGRGLLAALAKKACIVVTDDFPCFFLPQMVAAAARQLPVRLESVDSNGLLPLSATGKVFSRAFDFRRYLQKQLLPHLESLPLADPLADYQQSSASLPARVTRQWPAADLQQLAAPEKLLAGLPIDHRVTRVTYRGGPSAAGKQLQHFLKGKLDRYADERNELEQDVTSELSPYLHFGHISAHQIFAQVTRREQWKPRHTASKATGKSSGWWGTSPAAEAFLDQLITWRELGFNMCRHGEDYDRYESLPAWAQKTLQKHARDKRQHVYELEAFEQADTHDELWNAAQRQLVSEGRIHNYLRMLWGKKILEWSATPRDALEVMLELNNKYAVDGRDPNSYSGIFWVLGRYDRAWGPERPIFGTVRYMSSENTARKYSVKAYLRRFGKDSTTGHSAGGES